MLRRKTAPKGPKKERATAADKRVATTKAEYANKKTSHLRLAEAATRSDDNANKARTDL